MDKRSLSERVLTVLRVLPRGEVYRWGMKRSPAGLGR